MLYPGTKCKQLYKAKEVKAFFESANYLMSSYKTLICTVNYLAVLICLGWPISSDLLRQYHLNSTSGVKG